MFCWNWLKLRITFQPLMPKARVVEPKNQGSFVDSHETMWGSQSGGRGLNHLLDRFINLKCCKFLPLLWWLPPGLEGSSHPIHQHHHLGQPLGERCMNLA